MAQIKLPLHEAMKRAVAVYNRGQLAEADHIVQAILSVKNDYFDALHLLAVLKAKRRQFDEALAIYDRALVVRPDEPEALNNRGNALKELNRLEEALTNYDQALILRPNFAGALYNRGNALKELRRYDEALTAYDRAVAVRPDYAKALNDRGITLQALKRFGDALKSYDDALAARPNYADALNNRGNLLLELRRFEEALASFERALAVKPDFAEALYNRGITYKQLQEVDKALASYDEAIAVRPNYAKAFNNRGITLQELRRFDDALSSYDKALALYPDYPEALNNRGNTLRELKRFNEALTSYDRALTMRPTFAEALNNRGVTLETLQRFDEAVASYDLALAARADYAEAHNNRANSLRELRQFKEALASYDRALAVRPNYAEAHSNRGNTLIELRRFEEALACYDRALVVRPEFADALYNRGNALKELNRFDEALASYQQALLIAPAHMHAFDGVAETALRICDWSRTEALLDTIKSHVLDGSAILSPFVLLGYSSDPKLQLKCAQNYITDRFPTRHQLLPDKASWPHDKIRVAYLSADFHRHPTALLMAELFELHDRSRFEVLAISFGVDDNSDMRLRLKSAFDQFHDVRSWNDLDVAKFVRKLEVDIAVDLKGYTRAARPGILAYRPAPIQVSYLGFPGTMGAYFIDYVIADELVLPFDQQSFYTERIVHLPECYQPNDTKGRVAGPRPTRNQAGLPENGFVFCCFNNNYKITATIFDIWMRLLLAIDGSVLWLLSDNDSAERNLRNAAVTRGVDPARLVFGGRMPLEHHLARHLLADLFLDTLPYNAHTTASDALWMGLPLVTCQGEAFAGRVAASLLNAVGVPELITHSLEEYERLALTLATDSPRLRSIRDRLLHPRSQCSLFNTPRFRCNLEAAYKTMWEIWQRGKVPHGFSVVTPQSEIASDLD